tara:strand:- start:759 stop:1439 length:681 start_codon:yes stop_codon:yes gene_type:complete
MNKSNVISSWSGGKDSCLACYKAMLEGYNVCYLVNTISEEYKRVRFHGTESRIIQAQAKAIGIPVLQRETSGDNYERDFKEGVRNLISNKNVSAMVFGDIHLQSCLEWVEKICKELGIKAIEPLWQRPTKEILLDFIDNDFEAYVVSCQADLLDKKFIGQKLDRKFLEDISKLGIDVCGENGEYHTLVTDGPIFKQRIKLLESQKVLRDGYWFLDIRKYIVENTKN